MDVREKLVELLDAVQHYGTICTMSQMDDRYASITQVSNTEVAESLIAHGVTVQSEIDAKTYQLMRECERLKEEKESFANAVNVLEEINSDLYKKLKDVTVQEWISFDDVKPQDGQSVLGITTEGEMEVYYFYANWKYCLCKYGGNLKIFNITHWMPLPQPPKGE